MVCPISFKKYPLALALARFSKQPRTKIKMVETFTPSTEACEPRISQETVREALHADLDTQQNQKLTTVFRGEDWYMTHRPEQNLFIYHSDEERSKLIRDVCKRLYDAAADPHRHVESLDSVLSTLIECHWRPKNVGVEDIARQSYDIISRVAPKPTKLHGPIDQLDAEYFSGHGRKTWENLKVTSCIHRNLIRVVIFRVIANSDKGFTIRDIGQIMDSVAEMLDHICFKYSGKTDDSETHWFVVRSFLWSFWQRLKTLFIYFYLDLQVKLGFQHGNEHTLWHRNFHIFRDVSMRDVTERASREDRPANICTWAFQLLQNNPICFGVDFDLFFQRFAAVLGGEYARCQPNSRLPCDGKNADHCLRFRGAEVEDQSAHDISCSFRGATEPKLPWNRESYLSSSGARAVLVDQHDVENQGLQYCPLSEQTLAVSHVWRHGQGGRPEHGINKCLHQRYVQAAKLLGCDSYWMDTTCIPDDHDLRKEAIGSINDVFDQSKIILVCDQDIMSVDMSEPTITQKESLFTTVLMSDWNLRAWTLLEAAKGRRKLSLLCKNNLIVNFKQLVQDILKHGRIEIAIFAQLLPHMLPGSRDPGFVAHGRDARTEEISAEVAGSWLSYRPASKERDDVIIWSLLLDRNSKPFYDAASYWKNRIGTGIFTGFLMSSAPRLNVEGFGWAPRSPYAASRDPKLQNREFYRTFDGFDTSPGIITEDGLRGNWFVHEFDLTWTSFAHSIAARASSSATTRTDRTLDKIRGQFLSRYGLTNGALLHTINEQVASRFDGPGKLPGTSKTGTLLAVVETDGQTVKEWDNGTQPATSSYKWKWKGVYEWPFTIPLPDFKKEVDVWIA